MGRAVVLSFLLPVLVVANAAAETKKVNFKDFDEIAVGSGMHLSITQGETFRVEVTGALRDLDRLDVQQTEGHLKFSINSGWAWSSKTGRIDVAITLPALQRLDLSGGSQGTVSMQIGSKSFAADLSGGSSLSGQLSCGDIDLNLSGGSRADLSGIGGRLKVSGSGGSKYELKDFPVKNMRANLSGGSRVTVAVNGELSANMSGGSLITYYGNAALGSVSASGGSRIHQGL
jgi:hypothetical protein